MIEPTKKKILWADDEIDLLEAHVLFLDQHGYEVTKATNGEDAVKCAQSEAFDVVLLDEHMPGMDGLETAIKVKDSRPDIPIIMITKSEEESLMDDALGAKIADYLTKPVNPTQILVALKKVIDKQAITQKIVTRDYLTEFRQISMRLMENPGWEDWAEIHNRLCSWGKRARPRPRRGFEAVPRGPARRMQRRVLQICGSELRKLGVGQD